jgi:multiple sugar transport system permease protein
MYSKRSRYEGLLYLMPALVFVLIFTVYPFLQMLWMAFHDWPLLGEKKFIGLGNFVKVWNDTQFWTSLGFTLKYTLIITPILMGLGYLVALLVATNSPLRKFTRGVVFTPVVIGLGASSLLWYWLFNAEQGLINKLLIDLHLIAKNIVWFGANPDAGMWAVIVSVVWKVLGFGMILFVAAIQAIPSEINEATMIDGASYWQRIRRITLPLTYRTLLLVTLVSVVGSLLAFDQFYIMTAGQPRNWTATSVFFIFLNSFPFFKLGYGAALSLVLTAIIFVLMVLQMMLSRRSHA